MSSIRKHYLFSRRERSFLFVSLILILGSWCVYILSVHLSRDKEQNDFLTGCFIHLGGVVAAVSVHIRDHKYRYATYAIDRDAVTLFLDNKARCILKDNPYYVCIISLFEPGGRSYGYRKYIAMWEEEAPKSEVHPFVLLKKTKCLLIPYSESTISQIKIWTGANIIPNYPKALYHPQSISHPSNSNQI